MEQSHTCKEIPDNRKVEFDQEMNFWYLLNTLQATWISYILYCPYCGDKLPTAEQSNTNSKE